ncbi:transcriptional regulator Spx [Haploplasma modicum]|jgi:regulatory protein spx|uniref:transcriptional regulator Spx n=1 Tax=Haploplasma modicum TaxID=2150 RepID=UPI00138B1247|nr:transcriptional regulator Spx [Haploplasma modicum]MCR1808873.1 transcriptional regulator Spx [Haploplasma modicum]
MITIYTTPSCSSCRKAKKWLDEHMIDYIEKNLFTQPLTEEDIELMLLNAENGFDDIISTRSKIFKEQNLDIEDMLMSEIKEFIILNPSVLKRPIIVDETRLQVGYNDEEIRVFIPRRLRELLMEIDYSVNETEEYNQALAKYLQELKIKSKKR